MLRLVPASTGVRTEPAGSCRENFGEGIPVRGTAARAQCHGVEGRGDGTMPRLAGRHADYVADQRRRFQEGTRGAGQTPEHPVADDLTDNEILAVTRYIATLP